MDPNVIHEQPGLPENSGQGEDGAAYLRRLKKQPDGDGPSAPADANNAAAPVAKPAPAMTERRRSTRFQCSGSVEFQAEGSDVRMWGRLTDISLHGCYVEMSTTFPVNTKVTLVVDSLGIRVRAQATVRVSYPFLGMGMCFAEIEPGQQSQLEQLLTSLAGQRAILNAAPSEKAGLPEILASADAWACLEAVAEFFKKNLELSRDEFYQIAKRVRRS